MKNYLYVQLSSAFKFTSVSTFLKLMRETKMMSYWGNRESYSRKSTRDCLNIPTHLNLD